MYDYISDQPLLPKFPNPRNPILTVFINNVSIGNALIDLGVAINIMSMTTLQALPLHNRLRPTPTILKIAAKRNVKPMGVLDDIIVIAASWEYPVQFLVLQTEDPAKEHLVLLGRA